MEQELPSECKALIASIEARLERIRPKPRPKLTVLSETSLSLETQAQRLAQSQQRLMGEEKRCVEEEAVEQNRRVLAEQRASAFAELQSPRVRQEMMIDRWVESRREIEAHERWLRKHLDPDSLGLYEVEAFHGSEKDYRR
jgi:hypothetical protein